MALPQIGGKLPEPKGKFFLICQSITLNIKGGKAWGISYITAVLELIQLHFPSGMTAASQLLADFPRLQVEVGEHCIFTVWIFLRRNSQ